MGGAFVPSTGYKSVIDLAKNTSSLPVAFKNVFNVETGHPKAIVGPELSKRYGVAEDNVQTVICVTDTMAHQQCWYNTARTTKPQTFSPASNQALNDPTHGGGTSCDFCQYETLTARDVGFGRIEGRYAVTASNLFKYCSPSQGVVIFKHHDPLNWNADQLRDMIEVAYRWFETSAAQHPQRELYPLFVWNSLARAGASQYHGHAQVMLSDVPYPVLSRQSLLLQRHPFYWTDLAEAHNAIGLLRRIDSDTSCFASICPWKDAEIIILGHSMTSWTFQTAVHAALRALIDGLGIQTFNASIYNIDLQATCSGSNSSSSQECVPVVARMLGRGKAGAPASDFGGLEVFGQASIGHTDPFKVITAVDSMLDLYL